eukprot:6212360-Alexandrium_andersonii.AAC.1
MEGGSEPAEEAHAERARPECLEERLAPRSKCGAVQEATGREGAQMRGALSARVYTAVRTQ